MLIRRILILAVVLATAVVAAPTSGAGQSSIQRLTSVEQGVVREINRVRTAQDLRPLTVSSGLRTAAAAHTRAMLRDGFFEHSDADGAPFWERIKRSYPPRGDNWAVGETLYAKSAEPTPKEAVAAWLSSPAHREILASNEWRDVGIAVFRSASAGGAFGGRPTWVVTADFGHRDGTPS